MSRDTRGPLRAGDLSHSVTITAPAGTIDVAASDIDTGVPAAITVVPLPFQSAENFGAGGLQTQTRYTVSVRYRTDIQPSFVIVEECCTARTFQIVAIVPSDHRDAIDMTCVVGG